MIDNGMKGNDSDSLTDDLSSLQKMLNNDRFDKDLLSARSKRQEFQNLMKSFPELVEKMNMLEYTMQHFEPLQIDDVLTPLKSNAHHYQVRLYNQKFDSLLQKANNVVRTITVFLEYSPLFELDSLRTEPMKFPAQEGTMKLTGSKRDVLLPGPVPRNLYSVRFDPGFSIAENHFHGFLVLGCGSRLAFSFIKHPDRESAGIALNEALDAINQLRNAKLVEELEKIFIPWISFDTYVVYPKFLPISKAKELQSLINNLVSVPKLDTNGHKIVNRHGLDHFFGYPVEGIKKEVQPIFKLFISLEARGLTGKDMNLETGYGVCADTEVVKLFGLCKSDEHSRSKFLAGMKSIFFMKNEPVFPWEERDRFFDAYNNDKIPKHEKMHMMHYFPFIDCTNSAGLMSNVANMYRKCQSKGLYLNRGMAGFIHKLDRKQPPFILEDVGWARPIGEPKLKKEDQWCVGLNNLYFYEQKKADAADQAARAAERDVHAMQAKLDKVTKSANQSRLYAQSCQGAQRFQVRNNVLQRKQHGVEEAKFQLVAAQDHARVMGEIAVIARKKAEEFKYDNSKLSQLGRFYKNFSGHHHETANLEISDLCAASREPWRGFIEMAHESIFEY